MALLMKLGGGDVYLKVFTGLSLARQGWELSECGLLFQHLDESAVDMAARLRSCVRVGVPRSDRWSGFSQGRARNLGLYPFRTPGWCP